MTGAPYAHFENQFVCLIVEMLCVERGGDRRSSFAAQGRIIRGGGHSYQLQSR